MLYT
jgi:hypothetical protein